jgi:hypothetical protein
MVIVLFFTIQCIKQFVLKTDIEGIYVYPTLIPAQNKRIKCMPQWHYIWIIASSTAQFTLMLAGIRQFNFTYACIEVQSKQLFQLQIPLQSPEQDNIYISSRRPFVASLWEISLTLWSGRDWGGCKNWVSCNDWHSSPVLSAFQLDITVLLQDQSNNY